MDPSATTSSFSEDELPQSYFDHRKQPRPNVPFDPSITTLPSLKFPPQAVPHIKSREVVIAEKIRDSCVTKGAISFVAGFGLGAMFGLIMDSGSVDAGKTAREVLKESAARSYSTGKNFATFGLLFAATECYIEAYRGKTDNFNLVMAGCATGGGLGFRVGAKPAVIGCASVAAFTQAIEYFLHR